MFNRLIDSLRDELQLPSVRVGGSNRNASPSIYISHPMNFFMILSHPLEMEIQRLVDPVKIQPTMTILILKLVDM